MARAGYVLVYVLPSIALLLQLIKFLLGEYVVMPLQRVAKSKLKEPLPIGALSCLNFQFRYQFLWGGASLDEMLMVLNHGVSKSEEDFNTLC